MFVPAQYREPDAAWIVELVQNYPLALLSSNGGADGPLATHLPVIPDPATTSPPWTTLTGRTLLAHLNRANPHWSALNSGDTVLLVFAGPHAYVSPTVYGTTPAAPTWNFTSVHVRGVIEKIDTIDETLHVVQSTVQAYEGRFGDDWDMTDSLAYFRKIVPAVGALRISVTRADGMFKLSQEQQPEVRQRVRESFGGRECTRHRDTAALMSRLP